MIVDLFAGPRGWSQGLNMLGESDIGIEFEMNACRTAVAAGHTTVCADVSTIPIEPFRKKGVVGLIASPPCQDWSLAGKKAGIGGLRGQLVMEVLRWAEALEPEWIACEQVTTVLPYWKAYEELLRRMGYKTWSGILNAADYGVPQVRKRAILMASKRSFAAPVKTHAEFPDEDLFGDDRLPWITMAQALGWDGVHTVLDSRGDGGDGEHSRSDRFTTDRPARTLGEKARSWLVTPPPPDCPSWPYERPATTVVGSFRPDMMAPPGWRVDPKVPRQKAPDCVQITVEQAGILQSFPHDYPWSGARTRQFEQVGNACPPLLARAIVKELL